MNSQINTSRFGINKFPKRRSEALIDCFSIMNLTFFLFQITKVISKHKYGVYFYGTGETGNCKSEELDPYDDKNRSRFNTDRQMKKPDYKEAVDQIELAAKGSDPAPIITADESIKNSEEQNGDIEDTTMKTDDETSQTNDFDPDESQLQIAEEVPKSTPAPKKKAVNKPKAVSTPIIHAQQPPVDQSETKENDEKVSRSGRKIKEKKINNDEMDPDEVFTQPRKRLKIDSENRKPVQHLNDSAINDFCISKMQILQDPVRKQFLTVQFEMIKTIQDIKQTLGLEHVDVDRALDLCQQFKDKILPNITKLMILKFSNTVITIKRLRNYIGNFTSWNLDETQLVDFKEKAKLIREVASDMYNSLKVNIKTLKQRLDVIYVY